MKSRHLALAVLAAACALAPGGARAQDLGDAIANAIINSINRATINRAQQSWDAVDKDVQDCLARQYRINVPQLIQQGVGANDRRLRTQLANCGQYVEQQRLIAAQQEQARLEAEAAAAAQRAEEQRMAELAREARRSDLITRHGPTIGEAIYSGRVLVGMSREQVIEARGQPSRREQLTPTDEIWYYGGLRVGFANGRVRFVS